MLWNASTPYVFQNSIINPYLVTGRLSKYDEQTELHCFVSKYKQSNPIIAVFVIWSNAFIGAMNIDFLTDNNRY